MLPILRILPVGGVLLAIFILVLALSPPDGSRAPLNTAMGPARGALVDRNRHPETRQFLIQAALKRANELNRLRELPDTPTRTGPPPAEPAKSETPPEEPKVAVLPADRSEADPEETTAAAEMPTPGTPVEIGEPSSTDLPVTTQEKAATGETPDAASTRREVRRRPHRVRHPRPTTVARQRPFNLFEILFGGQQYQYQAPQYNGQQATQQTAYGTQQPQNQPRQQYYYGTQPNYAAQQPVYNSQATQVQPNYTQQQQQRQQQQQQQQQPIGSPPTFGEQPAPQVQQPPRAVQSPAARRPRVNPARQSAQSTGSMPTPTPAYPAY